MPMDIAENNPQNPFIQLTLEGYGTQYRLYNEDTKCQIGCKSRLLNYPKLFIGQTNHLIHVSFYMSVFEHILRENNCLQGQDGIQIEKHRNGCLFLSTTAEGCNLLLAMQRRIVILYPKVTDVSRRISRYSEPPECYIFEHRLSNGEKQSLYYKYPRTFISVLNIEESNSNRLVNRISRFRDSEVPYFDEELPLTTPSSEENWPNTTPSTAPHYSATPPSLPPLPPLHYTWQKLSFFWPNARIPVSPLAQVCAPKEAIEQMICTAVETIYQNPLVLVPASDCLLEKIPPSLSLIRQATENYLTQKPADLYRAAITHYIAWRMMSTGYGKSPNKEDALYAAQLFEQLNRCGLAALTYWEMHNFTENAAEKETYKQLALTNAHRECPPMCSIEAQQIIEAMQSVLPIADGLPKRDSNYFYPMWDTRQAQQIRSSEEQSIDTSKSNQALPW